jgi:predicted small lipoprotein YifL
MTLFLIAVLATACGKKGALTLPDQQPAPPTQEQPTSK